jgi:hypothetical protein
MHELLLVAILALPFAGIGVLVWLAVMILGTPSRRRGS